MPTTDAVPLPDGGPPPAVLILCAADVVAEDLIRELAGRRYQPLLSRPDWTWMAALEWAQPVAVVVDTDHPAVLSEDFIVAASNLETRLVIFGDPVERSTAAPSTSHGDVAPSGARDVRAIGRAVDAAVGRRLA